MGLFYFILICYSLGFVLLILLLTVTPDRTTRQYPAGLKFREELQDVA